MQLEGTPIIPQGTYQYCGVSVFDLLEGKKLKINTTGESEKVLEETVPNGKTWKIRLVVEIIENDA